MPEGLDQARDAFAAEIPEASRPRDQAGRFIATTDKPEPVFQPRPFEDEPNAWEPGEISQEQADGWTDEREQADVQGGTEGTRRAGGHEKHPSATDQRKPDGPGQADAAGPDDKEQDGPEQHGEKGDGQSQPDAEAGPRYEVNVDGETREVTLDEALKGYAREETFNKKMGELNQAAANVWGRNQQVDQALSALIDKANELEAKYVAVIPKEPADWDAEVKANPERAWAMRKSYEELYGKLAEVQKVRE